MPVDRIEEIKAERAKTDAFNEAWAASPEGQSAAAALQPDGGPEGWSQVPPAHPASPNFAAQRPEDR